MNPFIIQRGSPSVNPQLTVIPVLKPATAVITSSVGFMEIVPQRSESISIHNITEKKEEITHEREAIRRNGYIII